MRPEDVARFLKDHPEFFETYADMIGEISIPHPHGGRAIPIAERQIIPLREKNQLPESKRREPVEFGGENDPIGQRGPAPRRAGKTTHQVGGGGGGRW